MKNLLILLTVVLLSLSLTAKAQQDSADFNFSFVAKGEVESANDTYESDALHAGFGEIQIYSQKQNIGFGGTYIEVGNTRMIIGSLSRKFDDYLEISLGAGHSKSTLGDNGKFIIFSRLWCKIENFQVITRIALSDQENILYLRSSAVIAIKDILFAGLQIKKDIAKPIGYGPELSFIIHPLRNFQLTFDAACLLHKEDKTGKTYATISSSVTLRITGLKL